MNKLEILSVTLSCVAEVFFLSPFLVYPLIEYIPLFIVQSVEI